MDYNIFPVHSKEQTVNFPKFTVPLPGLKAPAQIVEDPLFISGPEGRHQILLRSVSRDPVDSDSSRDLPQASFQPVTVFLQLQTAEEPRFVVTVEICAPEHMEEMEFEPIGAGIHSVTR